MRFRQIDIDDDGNQQTNNSVNSQSFRVGTQKLIMSEMWEQICSPMEKL